MFDMTAAEGFRFALIACIVFAVVGGIVSQSSQGASAKGFWEGMWKGVEIFFLVLVAIGIIYAVLLGMGMINTTLNSSYN